MIESSQYSAFHGETTGRNEAHHSGFTDDRKYLWAGGLDTNKIFIFDEFPMRLVATLNFLEFLWARTIVTVCCIGIDIVRLVL